MFCITHFISPSGQNVQDTEVLGLPNTEITLYNYCFQPAYLQGGHLVIEMVIFLFCPYD
jgi:hypothetical protein